MTKAEAEAIERVENHVREIRHPVEYCGACDVLADLLIFIKHKGWKLTDICPKAELYAQNDAIE